MSLQESVSANVRVLAAARGTSPSALAVSLGRSRAWIQSKLVGRNGWSLADLDAVSEGLGVDAQTLMTTEWWPDELRRARRDSNPQPSDPWRVAA